MVDRSISPNAEPIESAFADARYALGQCEEPAEPPVILRLINERDLLRAENAVLGRRCGELEREVADLRALVGGRMARIEGWIMAADVAQIARFVHAASSS
ncbi:hypothetical protein AURDEDRAFT_177388 [Auricularia subglabra TFB-10046 SS5]|uniref:Uncharacterized protein n=1 Tax=Auricularia subglabra (strain TFB-10046 / SS5) TaxID=717982 RepID=J0WMF6_AURST|nr:hypothetical protein AURDEDRAFT_177388 [Auricularia subglabra TFB-10046 SS5]